MALMKPYTLFILESGLLFYAHYRTTVTGQSTAYLQVKTGNKMMSVTSLQVKAFDGGPVTTRLLEAPTVTDGTVTLESSTDGVVTNLNRHATEQTTITFYTDPTNVSGGDLILIDQVVSDGEVHRNGTENGPYPQFILDANEDYILSFENTGSSDADFHLTLVFYENETS